MFSLNAILAPEEIERLDATVKSKIEVGFVSWQSTVEELKIKNEQLQTKFDQQSFDSETRLRELREQVVLEHSKVEVLEIDKTRLEEEFAAIRESLTSSEKAMKEQETTLLELQRQKDRLIADNTKLTSLLSRRNDDFDRLTSGMKSSSDRLISSIREKEKQFEQKKELLTKQQQLLHELDTRNQELLTILQDQATKSIEIRTELAKKIEELRIAHESISSLKTTNDSQAARITELVDRVKELRDNEAKLQEIYRTAARRPVPIVVANRRRGSEGPPAADPQPVRGLGRGALRRPGTSN